MNFKYWKLMFFMILYMSIMMTVSAYTWFNMWIGLEINMMSIIPLMNYSKNIFSTESSLKYFIVQAMASSLILLSIIMMSMNLTYLMIMNSALLIKIGSAPFHFWFPEVMEGQLWNMCFNLMTIQKIAPFMLLNYNMNSTYFFMIIILMNMLISAFMGLNQISMRKILTFSSINHIGWMIGSIMYLKTVWMYYFMIYMIILMNIIYILNKYQIYFINQIIKINLPLNFKLIFIMNFFSMGGLPPFIGFLPKWLTIQMLVLNNQLFLMTIMVILTLLTLYYYIRIMLSSLMFSSLSNNKILTNNLIIIFNMLNMLMLPLTCLIYLT
uniref:NADH dehydrogenase subunit 2 n=1 Tax=Platystethus arenarius TaxID=347436 RepID=UPI002A804EB2|nr:NADH dehydrogenase subunit 2 [Platystethus arenarius]WON66108.1 NADH dehydrogenase subunit 2 [Platystethus arenarius]